MRHRLSSHISVVIIAAIVLAACGGSAPGRVSETEANPRTPPATVGGSGVASTTTGAQDAVTSPVVAGIGTKTASTESGEGDVGALPAGVFIGTPQGDGPIVKAQPTGSASTAPVVQQTAAPSQFDADGDGFYTFAEFQQAVAALYPSYEWPDNYQVDPTILLDGYAGSAERGDRFEVRGEYTIIGMRHTCAWEMAWLDGYREGDEALMAESLRQLRAVALENPLTHSSSLDYLKEIFERAELGDPAMLQQYVDSNCRRTDFIAPDTATPSGTP